MCSGTTSLGSRTMPSGKSGKRSSVSAIQGAYAPRRQSVTTAIVWFTRDLRVHDHPALRAALDEADCVIPFFCFDDRLLHGGRASGLRTQFILECVADLDESLKQRGGARVVRRVKPEEPLLNLGASRIH